MNQAPPASIEREDLREWVLMASRAPSSHNTQPWRFGLLDHGVMLWADRSRALPVNDPAQRELTISCGCALMSLRVAAAAWGRATQIELMPDAGDADALARLQVVPGAADKALAWLAPWLERRRTVRQRFVDRPVAPELLEGLAGAAASEGAALHWLHTPAQREAAVALVEQGDHRQWDDPAWRAELAQWMHPQAAGDGLAVPAAAAPLARLFVQHLDMGKRAAARDRALAESPGLLAVLTTEDDDPPAWLRAGQALQRVLLSACAEDLHASFLNQPVQLPDLRLSLAELTAGGRPQMLMRLGHAARLPPATSRRDLEQLFGAQAM